MSFGSIGLCWLGVAVRSVLCKISRKCSAWICSFSAAVGRSEFLIVLALAIVGDLRGVIVPVLALGLEIAFKSTRTCVGDGAGGSRGGCTGANVGGGRSAAGFDAVKTFEAAMEGRGGRGTLMIDDEDDEDELEVPEEATASLLSFRELVRDDNAWNELIFGDGSYTVGVRRPLVLAREANALILIRAALLEVVLLDGSGLRLDSRRATSVSFSN